MSLLNARHLFTSVNSLLIAALVAFSFAGCGAPRSTTVDDGLLIQSQAELKSLNHLNECPDLNGVFHRKDDASVTRTMLIGLTASGIAKMSVEKSSGKKAASVDGYAIDGLRHFSRKQETRSFDYLAICTQNRLRVSIFEGESNIHNILYIKTLEGFDIQQSGEFGASLTQWLPTK